jgi:hypothetical protein
MEGSGIGGGVAAANGGDAGGDALGQNGGENGNGADLAALMDQLSQMSSSQDELRQFLTAQPFQPQAGDGLGWAEGDGLDAAGLEQAGWDPGDDFGEGFGDELTGDPVRDAQVLGDHFNAAMHGVAEQAVAPLREHMTVMQRVADARDFTAEFPEVNDPAVAKQVMATTASFANDVLNRPDLAENVQLMRVLYLAGRALDSAQAEGAENPAAAHLEGGGGAGPGGGNAPSMVDQILNPDETLGLGRRVLPGST